jgi:ABC-type glycerol-3-phosphate transport system permease component
MPLQRSEILKTLRLFSFYLTLIGLCIIVVFPIYWLLVCSFQKETVLFSYPPRLFPQEWSLDGYIKVFTQSEMGRWIINTLIISLVTVFIVVCFSTLAAYSISRFKYKGRTFITLVIISTQMISGPMIITPLYILLSKVGLVDTYLSLIIADTALNLAISIWLMKGFFDTIPIAIEEAAMIDGCSRIDILRYITIPLSLSGIVTIMVLTFFVTWNEYLYSMIFISSHAKWMGSVGLASFVGSYVTSMDQVLAGAAVFSIIPIIFFLIFQRNIVMGVTKGAVK